MKGDGFAKLYDTLSVDELFRLRLRAMARGDQLDCERLDRACMGKRFSAYCDRLAATEVLTLSVMVELGHKLAKIEMLDAVRPLAEMLEGAASDAASMGYLDGYHAGWKAAGMRREPPDVSDATLDAASGRAYGRGTRISAMLKRATAELAGMARTPRDALAALAEAELGVSLSDLLRAWAPGAAETLADHAEALDAAQPDTEGLALFREVLSRAWRRHGLHDTTADIDDDLRARIDRANQQEHMIDA